MSLRVLVIEVLSELGEAHVLPRTMTLHEFQSASAQEFDHSPLENDAQPLGPS
jgi:hypothetical protein